MPSRAWLVAAGCLVAVHVPLWAAFPAPDGYVNDFAEVLDESAEAYLENYLQTLERDTSAELVIATVSSLDGMTIEDYANRLFAEWGIGQAIHDNGVLLLVAPGDRAVRIEVGYGLEPILPDGLAGDIIRAQILSEFRSGNYPRGIGRGLDRIARIVRGDPAAAARAVAPSASDDAPPVWLAVPFFSIFILLGSFVAGLGLTTKTYGPLLWGGMFAGIPLMLSSQLVSLPSLVGLLSFGVVALVLGCRRGPSPYWTGVLRKGEPDSVRRDEPLHWIMGGTSGSSTDGSSHSGGSSSSGGALVADRPAAAARAAAGNHQPAWHRRVM